MDSDAVLTGRKKNEITIEDKLYSWIGEELSEEPKKEALKKKPFLRVINPKPHINVIELKGKDGEIRPGIEIGLNFSF